MVTFEAFFGPFLVDSTNNDASIINNCLFQNEEGILNWLLDDDVVILDKGFRDVISSTKNDDLQPAIPDFLRAPHPSKFFFLRTFNLTEIFIEYVSVH